MLSSSLVAYGFSRVEWKGRDKLFMVLLATMMVPFPVIMVPTYNLFKHLGWIGSFKPLWVPSFFAGAFNGVLVAAIFSRPAAGNVRSGARLTGAANCKFSS